MGQGCFLGAGLHGPGCKTTLLSLSHHNKSMYVTLHQFEGTVWN